MISIVHTALAKGEKHLCSRVWYEKIQKAMRDCIRDWTSMDTAIVFLSEPAMRIINRRYHKQNRVTDVLSFFYPKETGRNEGELYVCIPWIRRQAKRYGLAFIEEYIRVLVHGFLHLQGYDHIKISDRKIMENFEKKILSQTKKDHIWYFNFKSMNGSRSFFQ